ncbi:DUF554 family protein [Desmospora profundinema]|uniref:Membrane protein YqgA involved in biofilm formation n=1 Tax=Desmospora profundinema TaxID=1571184 RepID=A0ABU1IKS0_9BACL|nr:DUF554 family protein [Desmospora profundinema]MDR6225379.1 putative membrane protein YqgA involved in biofilm formation [Desmospora profundinema]
MGVTVHFPLDLQPATLVYCVGPMAGVVSRSDCADGRLDYSLIGPKLLEPLVLQVTAVGGILIVAIGLKLLKGITIRVGDMLPALPAAAVVVWFQMMWLA